METTTRPQHTHVLPPLNTKVRDLPLALLDQQVNTLVWAYVGDPTTDAHLPRLEEQELDRVACHHPDHRGPRIMLYNQDDDDADSPRCFICQQRQMTCCAETGPNWQKLGEGQHSFLTDEHTAVKCNVARPLVDPSAKGRRSKLVIECDFVVCKKCVDAGKLTFYDSTHPKPDDKGTWPEPRAVQWTEPWHETYLRKGIPPAALMEDLQSEPLVDTQYAVEAEQDERDEQDMLGPQLPADLDLSMPGPRSAPAVTPVEAPHSPKRKRDEEPSGESTEDTAASPKARKVDQRVAQAIDELIDKTLTYEGNGMPLQLQDELREVSRLFVDANKAWPDVNKWIDMRSDAARKGAAALARVYAPL
jgi:hypothetical protein